MKNKYLIITGLIAALLMVGTSIALASSADAKPAARFAETVRRATAQFKDVEAAKAAGYRLFHGCTSGPQDGAMGIHFANGSLVGDGALDENHPEVLLYEPKDDGMQLVGVEYLVFAEDWNKNHTAPPVLMGQLFNYLGAPNRYGLPALYELHVWAWKGNRAGMFADWNARVSCEDFAGDTTMPAAHH